MIDTIVERFGGTKRSPQWNTVRKKFVEANAECLCCGSKNKLQVHHVVPFCVDPTRELDENNLATLCSRCHLLIGHCGWWQTHNPNFKFSVQQVRAMLKSRRGCNFGSFQPPSWLTQIIQRMLSRWYHF